MAYTDAYPDCEWMDFETLEKFMVNALKGEGVPEEDAKIAAEVLITSDKRGIDSHGIGRLKPIYIDRMVAGTQNPVTKIDIIKETETTAVLDGNNGLGHVIAKHANNMAIAKAKKYGLGMVTVRNSTHYGIAGYYVLDACKAGCIGITGTNARPSIAPTFGVENMLGTNPLVFGCPTDEPFPFVLDCATSVSQRGKLEVYGRAGKELPSGWVIGEDGKSRTDTQQVLIDLTKGKAALAPLGGLGEETAGFKGYGYATVVEILSAALQDGKFLKMLNGVDENGNKIPILLGHFFMAIDIDHFLGLDLFKKITGTICRDLRNSKKAPGAERIYTAGEKEYLAWQERKKCGCPVPKVLQHQMDELNEQYKLNYTFSWNR